uniref:EF-1-gamma C-terminal domain-containing protein n=1 Tax=Corethron hystrix TaxID=216773 RepID=A0A7S1B9Y4_9STRA|mmetsp:Transcript_18855/g.42997  ORF Transcript_18855/g.42997 Transcript_18855/m.42997 type:complete len:181 (+) Transcript_18855:177-719(+)
MAEEQSEETKMEARQFMADLVSSAPRSKDFTGGDGIDMASWKTTYAASSSSTAMEKLWSMYDPSASSIWTMSYDEAEDNEHLDETIAISKDFMKLTESISDHCFGVMHTVGENLDIKGLWIFNGPDPEKLFSVNEDSSWFTWSELGPEANDYVKKAVAEFLTPVDGKLKGDTIKDTQVFA